MAALQHCDSPQRRALSETLAARVAALPCDRIVRVGIDGVDGAGKTCLANELAQALRLQGKAVIRASVDGFHNPREIRYRLGKHSPDGFYLDSYNYHALHRNLLDPLSPGGTGRYRVAVFDHVTNTTVTVAEEEAVPGSIFVFDGIFLHRPELAADWDFTIFLQVDFNVSIPRLAGRDTYMESAHPAAASNQRYVAGQKRYLRECNPEALATITIDNTNLAAPIINPSPGFPTTVEDQLRYFAKRRIVWCGYTECCIHIFILRNLAYYPRSRIGSCALTHRSVFEFRELVVH